MSSPDHQEIEKARRSIVDLVAREFRSHGAGELNARAFGEAVAPLVNALAALSLMEKQDRHADATGAASRSDD